MTHDSAIPVKKRTKRTTMRLDVGIDLGGARSATPRLGDNGQLDWMLGETTIPSVVLIRDNQIQAGDAALNQGDISECIVQCVKRVMGDPDQDRPKGE